MSVISLTPVFILCFQPKKNAHIPRPPSSGRPSSKARYWRTNSGKYPASSLNKTPCLPPLRQTISTTTTTSTTTYQTDPSSGPVESSVADGVFAKSSELAGFSSTSTPTVGAAASTAGSTFSCSATRRRLDAIDSAKVKSTLSSVKENQNETASSAELESKEQSEDPNEALASILRRASRLRSRSPKKLDFSQEVLLKEGGVTSAARNSAATKRDGAELHHRETSSISPPVASRGLERLLSQGGEGSGPGRPSVASSSHDELYSRPPTTSASKPSSKYGSERRPVTLESLNASEVRAMSGVLSNIVRSANKSRSGYTFSGMKDMGRITPESRMIVSLLPSFSHLS